MAFQPFDFLTDVSELTCWWYSRATSHRDLKPYVNPAPLALKKPQTNEKKQLGVGLGEEPIVLLSLFTATLQ